MAVFFNCSFARAAVKAHTASFQKGNHPLTDEGRAKRLAAFREQFHFSATEVCANPLLAEFSAATACPQKFDLNCKRLLAVYNLSFLLGKPVAGARL